VPAVRAARPDVIQALRGGRAQGWGRGALLRNGVVVAEVALSFVLMIGSGLMFRSFLILRRIEPGYQPAGLLTFFVTREWPLTRQDGRLELLRRIRERLLALPGVENVSASLILPLSGGSGPRNPAADSPDYQQVLPGYFETLRTPLLEGRTFTEADNAPGRRLAVIDQHLAAREFPGESAVGKRVRLLDPAAPWAEVIGVVANQRLFSLRDPGRGTIYLTDGFWGIGVSRSWMIRVAGDPTQYANAVRAELARIDRQLVISKVQPMTALVDQDQAETRLSLLLLGSFAVMAMLLASVGLYGVLATVVRQRTAEIGVRMALGATPSGIFRFVVGHGLRLTAAGLTVGLCGALALTRVMAAMLVGVKATDASTFAVMALVFMAVSALASWAPAARAAGLDPNASLKGE
jgi:putative ABC transport system permease protein